MRRIGLILLILLLHQAAALAEVELFTVSAPAEAAPREFVTLVFGIINHEAVSDTFRFEAKIPEGFSPVALPPPLELGPGEEGRVFLALFVAATARAGENEIRLTAVSTSDPTISASASALVVVQEVPAVEVIAPAAGELEPGGSVTLTFTVWNRGNTIDRFVISASSRRRLELVVEPRAVELLAGESAEVTVTVAAPPDEEPGRDFITLIATSLIHPDVADRATVAITILPPLPQEVCGTLYLEIPTDFRVSMDLSRDGGASSLLGLEGAEVIDEESLALSLGVADLLDLEHIWFGFTAPNYEIELGDISASLTPLVRAYGRGARVELDNRALSARLGALGLARRGTEAERVEIALDGGVITLRPPEAVVELGGRVEFANLTGSTITISSPEAGLMPVHLGPGEGLYWTFGTIGAFSVRIAIPGYSDVTATVHVVAAGERLVETAADLTGEFENFALGSLFLLRSTVQAGFTEGASSILSGALHWEPAGGLALEAEGAWSTVTMDGETVSDLGGRAFSSLKVGGLTTTVELLHLGTGFAAARHDEEGFKIEQYLSNPLIRYGFRFRRSHDNVAQDPALPTVLEQRARVSSLIYLGEGGPSLGLQFDYRSRKSSGPPPLTDKETMLRSIRFNQPLGPLTLSPFEEWTHQIDRVLGTEFVSERLGLDLPLRVEDLSSLFRISQTTRYDLTTGLIAERSAEVLVQAGLGLPWGRLAFSLSRRDDSTALTCGADVEIGERGLSSAIRLSLPDGGEPVFSLSLGFVGGFELPFPFILTKGRVEGEVFIDANGNGRRDEDEEGVGGLILQIDRTLARTDDGGLFRFPPLHPGDYRLEVKNLPVGLVATVPLPIAVSLRAGETVRVAIPLRRTAAIEGTVFDDVDRNGVREAGEGGLAHIRVVLSGEGLEQEAFTDGAGEFLFPDLLPGSYTVRLDTASLPEHYEPTTPATVEVQLRPGEVAEVEFGAAEKERRIIITFQPPLAEFAWSPEEPQAGEAVTFDASASFDPDGEIVKYEWDFDGDGLTDAEGVTATWTFNEAGDYPVTLTVTDNDGYTSTATKTITVRSP